MIVDKIDPLIVQVARLGKRPRPYLEHAHLLQEAQRMGHPTLEISVPLGLLTTRSSESSHRRCSPLKHPRTEPVSARRTISKHPELHPGAGSSPRRWSRTY